MRFAFGLWVLLAGCWRAADTRQPRAAPAPPPAIRLRAPELGSVSVLSATALDDGGLIIVGTSFLGIRLDKEIRCAGAMFFARLDGAGRARWTRCAPADHYRRIVAAASDAGVWVARIVDPNASDHVHGDSRDLIVVERYTATGEPAGSRVVSVFFDPQRSEHSARNAADNMQLTAATIANGELILAGSSKSGGIVGGQWQIPESYISLHGFVLGIPADGPVRSVFDSGNVVIEDVSTANGRFVATGWCSTSTKSAAVQRVSCSGGGTTAFSVDGTLAGDPNSRVRVFGQDIYDVRSAIANDGSIVIAGTSWRNSIDIEGAPLSSKCAKFAFAAAFSPRGTRAFARVLGDCRQHEPSPYAIDGAASSAADDQISDQTFDIHDVAFVNGAPVIVVGVAADTNHVAWPVRFDGVPLSVPFARAAALLVLDARGTITSHRMMRFIGPSEVATEPDASFSNSAGVRRVIVTAAKQAWAIVEHAGSVEIDGVRFALRTKLGEARHDSSLRESPCHEHALRKTPRSGREPEDGECRQRVITESALEVIRL